jgi:hypothetical protein
MIKFSDIQDAFFFVSSAAYGMHSAVLRKDTGQILYSPSPECPTACRGDEWQGEPSEALAKEGKRLWRVPPFI